MMSSNSISHNRPTLGTEEELAAQCIIRSGWLSQGEEVVKFEKAFCDFVGLPHFHAVAVSSGTAALYLALLVLNAKDKKVAFPSYVCAAVRYAVNMAQGHEVVIDTEANTPNVSIGSLNKSGCDISIVPHMYGIPVEMDKIRSKYIIEDCCQALGATLKGKSVGLHGDVGVFSFYATKLITSGGQGGMIISKNKSLIDEIKDYREFDMRHDKKMRFNFQMTDLQATIGIEQLKKLPAFLKRREEIYNMYIDAGLSLQPDKTAIGSKPIRFRAILITDQPQNIIKKLANDNIKAIIPIEDWELLAATPNALKYTLQTVSLPIYPGLTNDQVKYIINKLKSY
jgi:perosamine synthetase